MSESLSFVMNYVSSLADSFSLAESSSWSFGKPFTETPTLTDAPALSFGTGFTDSATISESILVELVIGKGAKLNQSALNIFTLNS
jgi:hypothetical protein